MNKNKLFLNFTNFDIVESDYYHILLKTSNFSNYVQVNTKDLFLTGKNSSLFTKKLNEIKSDYIYDSEIHGITHNERVALLSYYIALNLGLSLKEQELLIDASFYHDTGRINDYEDVWHGDRSSILIDEIITGKDDNYKTVLKVIIKCHSHDDYEMNAIIKNSGVDFKKTKLFACILKDADALDRIRFFGLDPSFLRLDISKSLLNASAGIYFTYCPTYLQKKQLSIKRKHSHHKHK